MTDPVNRTIILTDGDGDGDVIYVKEKNKQ